jgi:hypothetical protein
MSKRLKDLLKLSRETLTTKERWRLESVLNNAQGYDYIDDILKENGFERGTSFDKNKYHLLRGGEVLNNVFLFGDYRGMKIVHREAKEKQQEKKYKIPYDAYTSPAALYELWEMEKESKED